MHSEGGRTLERLNNTTRGTKIRVTLNACPHTSRALNGNRDTLHVLSVSAYTIPAIERAAAVLCPLIWIRVYNTNAF
ncbi:hypothetical protein PHYPO_G00045050 [Pangasianodon hypophthalmus]|uniref:Uncharacterized protein n=1 Tax=Pangasianodon hypophthalmus TaxID=310915 RepID=A0A5N5MG55_PANHP|nr:hypothetical protein PHYPO_G00045050 [Pangasianodon hypophthalmus]